jgi:hypothetical protein
MRPDDVIEIVGDDLGVVGRTGHIAVGPNQPEPVRVDRRTYIGVEQSCKSVSSLAVAVVRSASGAKSSALPDPMGDWWGPGPPKARVALTHVAARLFALGHQQPSAERPPWARCGREETVRFGQSVR